MEKTTFKVRIVSGHFCYRYSVTGATLVSKAVLLNRGFARKMFCDQNGRSLSFSTNDKIDILINNLFMTKEDSALVLRSGSRISNNKHCQTTSGCGFRLSVSLISQKSFENLIDHEVGPMDDVDESKIDEHIEHDQKLLETSLKYFLM